MKILFVTRRFYPDIIGGGQISAYHIAKALKDLGNDVFVCTFTSGKYIEEKIDGIQVYRFPLNYVNIKFLRYLSDREYMYLQMTSYTNKLVNKIKPEIIHALNIESIPSVAYVAKMKHNIPFFATINGPMITCFVGECIDDKGNTCIKCNSMKMLRCVREQRKKLGFLEWVYGLLHMEEFKFFAKKAERLFPVSNAMKQLLINTGYDEDLLKVIHNPISAQNKVETNLKEQLGIQGKVILYAGRLAESKGVQNVIYAMEHIHDAVFLVLGKGKYREKLETLAEKCNVKDKVRFMGFVEYEKLKEYYSIADVVVLPCTFYEPLSRMLLEACSYGIPMIASNVGGNPEIVEHNKNGILLQTQNIDELAGAIKYILDNPDIYNKMCRNCKKKIKEFSPEKIGEQILEAYEAL